jgi:hypothetical protein
MSTFGEETELAHRVSWFIHFGDPEAHSVLHKCDNPPCVRPDHLFLGSFSENMDDKIEKGRQQKGEGHWRHKLTDRDILKIIELRETGMIQSAIAREYGVHQSLISYIVRRKYWKHLFKPPLPSSLNP